MRGTRLLTVVLFLAALCVLAPSALAASGWYELGQNGTQFSTWTEFDLVDFGGSPLMAWHGRDPNGTGADYNKFGVFAAMFDGHPLETNPWKDVAGGTGAFFPNLSNFPSAAVVGGTLYVAAAIPSVPDDAFNPNRKIHVAKLVGSTWQDVGSPLNDPSSSGPGAGGPVIADVGGVPYVMFGEQETGAGTPIFRVKKWNGSAWVELGSGTHPLQPSVNDYAPAADFASIGGQPYVTLVDKKPLGGYNPIAVVKRYDSGTNTWVNVGGGVSGPDQYSPVCASGAGCAEVWSVSLADIGTGVPYLAYAWNDEGDPTPPGRVLVKRYDSGSDTWVTVGGGPANHDLQAPSVRSTSLAGNSNTPYVAWEEYDGTNFEARVAKLRDGGTGWDELGGGASPINRNGEQNGREIKLRFVGANPTVAFAEDEIPPDTQEHIKVHVATFGQGPINFGRPGVTGSPKIPGTLHCTLGRWGADASEFKITWQRAPHDTFATNDPAWHAIDGAVGSDYTLQDDDAGSRIRCLVSAANSVFATDSPSRSVQADYGPPKMLEQPKVAGDTRTGHTMTCDPGQWTNNPDFTYEWYGNAGLVKGETSSTYKTNAFRDRDEALACRVYAQNDLGSFASFSNNVHIVRSKPVKELDPRVFFEQEFGTINPVGQTAHCTSGKWHYDYAEYRYEWLRDDNTPIPGASGRTYKTTIDDLGHELHCKVFSTNPWGEGKGANSNSELIPLPKGVGTGTKFKTGGYNEFDPVNMMALSDGYKDTIDKISAEKYQAAVDDRRRYCKNDFPDRDKIPPPDKLSLNDSDFVPFTDLTQCKILVDRPESDLTVGYWGVQYTGPVFPGHGQPAKRCTADRVQSHHCNDMGFYVDPVTPGKEGDLPADIQLRVAPVTPEHVLWDFNNDKKIDADCPSSAPVVRTMLDKGKYHVHAVIVDKNSAETGVYWNADFDFDHPKANGLTGGLRPGQVFACRTSLEPPPSPKFEGTCLTNSKIGRVQVEGNFCPIDLRNLDPNLLDNLADQSPDVYQILKQVAERRDVGASLRPKPAHVNVPLGTNTLAAADANQVFAASSASSFFSHQSTEAAAFKNTLSSINLFDNSKASLTALNGGDAFRSDINFLRQALNKKFDPAHAPFALDQIYLGHGPVKVNGTLLDPTGDYDKQPTLITPTDAGNVAEDGQPEKIVKSMILNNTSVRTALGGPNGEITLDPASALKREVGDIKKAGEDEAKKVLRENLNVDKYKQQIKDEIKQKIQEGKDAAARQLRKAIDALDLGPLKISGTSVHVDINDDGTATLTAIAAIPFLQDPTAQPTDEDQDPTAKDPTKTKADKGAVRVEVKLKGDLSGKLTLQGVHVNLNRADLGVLELHGVDFTYDNAAGVNLTGDILIPPTREGVRIENFMVNNQGQFQGVNVFYLAGAGSGIPIGSPAPIYLTSLGGGFHFLDEQFTVPGPNGQPQQVTKNVARIEAGATFSVGPSPTGQGCATLGLKTAAKVDIGGIPVFVADVTGNIEVVCVPIETVHFHVDSTGFVYLTADVDLSVGPVFVKGGLKAGINLPHWQFAISGTGGIKHVPFLDDLHVEAVLSDAGLAGCASIKIPIIGHVAGGAAVKFNNGVPPLTYPQLVANFRIFTGCDLGAYRTVLKRRAVRKAAVSQTSFTMPGAQRGVVVSLEGAGHAPHVKLKSPSGKVYDLSNATNGVKFTDGIGTIVEDEDRSVAILGKPQAGVWTIITAAGSTAVNRIQIAPILPAPNVKGTVTGKGAKRTLHYTVGKQVGQVVRFVETTTGSAKTIGTVTGGGTGKFNYLTGESTDGRRTVIAQVVENGTPRTNVTIAHYMAPNPRVGKPGHMRIKRKKGKAVVTWKRAQLAASYVVSVTDSHGGRAVYSPTGLKLTVPNVAKNEGVHVRVFGVSRAGRRGSPAKASLKGPHKKHKKKHHKKKHHHHP